MTSHRMISHDADLADVLLVSRSRPPRSPARCSAATAVPVRATRRSSARRSWAGGGRRVAPRGRPAPVVAGAAAGSGRRAVWAEPEPTALPPAQAGSARRPAAGRRALPGERSRLAGCTAGASGGGARAYLVLVVASRLPGVRTRWASPARISDICLLVLGALALHRRCSRDGWRGSRGTAGRHAWLKAIAT